MRWLRRLLLLFVLVAVAALGILFSVQNDTPVPLDLLLVQLPPLDVSVWLISALGIGVILGMLAASLALLKLSANKAALKRQLAQSEREITRLKTLSHKD